MTNMSSNCGFLSGPLDYLVL